MGERRNDLEIVIEILQIASQIPNSDRSPLYDVRNPARASCEGHACEVMFSRTNLLGRWSARLRPRGLRRARFVFGPGGCATRSRRRSVVEPDGIEPTTSCLQSTRSPS